MKALLIIGTVCILLSACGENNYYTEDKDNPVYHPNTVFESFEDMASPSVSHLITKYRLDTIFHGEDDEFKRILLLRHWMKSVIPVEDYADPYPGAGNVEQILDYALEGQGYHCGHFMRVQNAIMSSFGYVTRTLGAGPGVQEARFAHHGTNEIWINKYNKWFMSDAKYDHHFEKDGIPLSALEIRNEYLKNEGADILMVKGPDRTPLEFDDEMDMAKTEFAQTYTWITWDTHNDIFTAWSDRKNLLIVYDDEYNQNNTWIRGTRPHWIYGSPESLRLVQERDAVYFTPNTIASRVKIDDNIAVIALVSDTPSLKEYQLKTLPGNEWAGINPEYELELKNQEYELLFRAVNHAGVAGPEHRIRIVNRK